MGTINNIIWSATVINAPPVLEAKLFIPLYCHVCLLAEKRKKKDLKLQCAEMLYQEPWTSSYFFLISYWFKNWTFTKCLIQVGFNQYFVKCLKSFLVNSYLFFSKFVFSLQKIEDIVVFVQEFVKIKFAKSFVIFFPNMTYNLKET